MPLKRTTVSGRNIWHLIILEISSNYRLVYADKNTDQVIKNVVGCRDDTVPKNYEMQEGTTDRACNNLPQPNPYFWGLWKIIACSQLLVVPSCIDSF